MCFQRRSVNNDRYDGVEMKSSKLNTQRRLKDKTDERKPTMKNQNEREREQLDRLCMCMKC